MRASDSVFKKLPFYLGVALLVLFCLGGLGLVVLESPWAQKKLFSELAKTLEESGWSVSAEKIEGSLFDEIRLSGVSIITPEGDEIRAASLKAHLSLLRLAKREIAFQGVQGDQISWTAAFKKEGASRETAPWKGIPFSLLFSNFSLSRISLPESSSTASLEGTLRIGRYNKRARLGARVKREDALASLSLVIHSNGQAKLQLAYESPSIANDAAPWLRLLGDGSAALNLQLKGTWSDFLSYFAGKERINPIRGILRGSAIVNNSPSLKPLLERRWTFFSNLDLDSAGDLKIEKLTLRGGSLILTKGSLTLSKALALKTANLQITAKSLKDMEIAPIDGLILAHIRSKENQIEVTLSSPELAWNGFSLEHPLARLHLTEENGIYSGPFEGAAKLQNEDLAASLNLWLEPKKGVVLDQIQLASALANINGSLSFYAGQSPEGALAIQTPNLHLFDPSLSLYGKGSADFQWKGGILEISGKGQDLFYAGVQARSAFLYADLSETENRVYAELQNVQEDGILIETLSLDLESTNGISWPARLFAEGDWKGPFVLASNGIAVYKKPDFAIDLQDLSGTLFFQPLALGSEAKLQVGPSLFSLENFNLLIGSASIQANVDHWKDKVEGSLLLDRVPLDFLSLNPLDISVAGSIDLKATFSQAGGKAKGTFEAEISDIEIGTQNPFTGHTRLSGSLSQDRLSLNAAMEIQGDEALSFSSAVPWKLRFFPLVSELSETKPAKAHLAFQGRIEEILDFFDIGPHRLEGNAVCDLSLRGPLGKPLLQGSCRLENGTYENYVTGFELKQLQADILADKSSLILRSLTAKDSQNKGSFSLSGDLSLVHQNRFPFRFDGTFSRLNTTDLAWMKLEAGGAIQISGDIDSARITGQAVVLEGDMSIPDRIPPTFPDLQVHYVNLIKPLPAPETAKINRYPIFFDYRILAPEGIYISGKGLESEWKGDFQIGGTFNAIEAKGALSMLTGGFTFAGRTFELTEGALTFTGRPKEMPILNIAARMQLQNLILIARLKGFLNAPQLSFHSTPPLPMGSILSYLLFGQDMSDISAIQAAQIVNSLSSLSGGTGDVFDNTRRSIGVDRLRIVAAPVGEEGGEAYSLQVGKYVTRGVLVSVSQGTEKDTTNLSVEIDLSNGLVIEAESMQQEEQGKFTLKWNYNY